MTAVANCAVFRTEFLRGEVSVGFHEVFRCCFESLVSGFALNSVAAGDRVAYEFDSQIAFGSRVHGSFYIGIYFDSRYSDSTVVCLGQMNYLYFCKTRRVSAEQRYGLFLFSHGFVKNYLIIYYYSITRSKVSAIFNTAVACKGDFSRLCIYSKLNCRTALNKPCYIISEKVSADKLYVFLCGRV